MLACVLSMLVLLVLGAQFLWALEQERRRRWLRELHARLEEAMRLSEDLRRLYVVLRGDMRETVVSMQEAGRAFSLLSETVRTATRALRPPAG